MNLTIEQLAQAWLDAKQEEESAIAKRRSIGELIAEAMPGAEDGTERIKNESINVYVTRKMTRSVDADALSASWGALPEKVRSAFKWKSELVTKQFRAMQELDAPELSEVLRFVTTKPATPTVSVERIFQE